MSKIQFNNKKSPFFKSLKEKVDDYFSTTRKDSSGNAKLYLKSILQVSTALGMYVTLVFFTPGVFISLLLCALLGINLALLGFNIMHEGGHQSFSKHKWLNKASAYFLNVLGGNSYFWKIKHNINHHTYTNIEGMDTDIEVKPFMRLHEEQPRSWYHKFQHIYWIILYGASYFMWIFYNDFQKYFTGRIAPEAGEGKKMDFKEHVIFWVTKILYAGVYIVIPILMIGVLKTIIGFAVICFTCGLSISIVFQLAHIVEGTSFPKVNEDTQKIEQEWAIHQINTTADFATKSKLVSWLLGGLNFQVEHHLFPKISHVHYPEIRKMVKETCEEFKVKYLEFPSTMQAIYSHLMHIKRLGKA
jgi:linoleoyl-CoA desaturase